MITVKKVSPVSGKINEMELPLTESEYQKGVRLRESGELIQNAFPTLNADQREFLITGMSPQEWDKTFGE